MSRALSVVALLLAAASRLPAQSANDLLQQGVRAYQRLEYDAAVALLRESLLRRQPMALADSQRARALSYLAATELFQQQRDSAAAAFRDLVRLDPRYRPTSSSFRPKSPTCTRKCAAQPRCCPSRYRHPWSCARGPRSRSRLG